MLAALQDLEMEEEIPGKDLHTKLASHVNHRGKLLMRSYLPKASFIQHSLGGDSTGGSKAKFWGWERTRRDSCPPELWKSTGETSQGCNFPSAGGRDSSSLLIC